MKKSNKISFILTLIILLTPLIGLSQSVIGEPNDRLLNPPITADKDGQIHLKNPMAPKVRPPKIISSCLLENLAIRVIKQNGKRRGQIQQNSNGQITVREVPNVITLKLTKDMLGQYAAAVTIAQELGLTELDYVKIYLVDPQPDFKNSKALVSFFDNDDDLIEKTIVIGDQWLKCQDE